MTPEQETRVRDEVRKVVRLLVEGRYGELASRTAGRGLNAEQIAAALAAYPDDLVPSPEDAFRTFDIDDWSDDDPPGFGVRFTLHTAEHGESDLVLFLTIRMPGRRLETRLKDIYVP